MAKNARHMFMEPGNDKTGCQLFGVSSLRSDPEQNVAGSSWWLMLEGGS